MQNSSSHEKAKVAPIELAKDTKIKAHQNPNKAPPAKVTKAAAGNEKLLLEYKERKYK